MDGQASLLELMRATWQQTPDTHWLVEKSGALPAAVCFDLVQFARDHGIKKIAVLAGAERAGLSLVGGDSEVRVFAAKSAAMEWLTAAAPSG